jgi:hypothetical protein
MTPKFRCGEAVHIGRNIRFNSAAGGEYKIMKLLPESDGEVRYRVKSVCESHERVVREDDLEKA